MVTGAVATGLAGALSGCSDGSPARGRAPGATGGGAETGAALRKRLAAASGEVRDRYDATIARHPALAARLTDLRTSVAAHATALGAEASAPGAASADAPASVGGPLRVPADSKAALRALAAAERRAADAHTAALADAEPELARLLASMAAAGAAHAYLLTSGDA